jgi:hypothetical protein
MDEPYEGPATTFLAAVPRMARLEAILDVFAPVRTCSQPVLGRKIYFLEIQDRRVPSAWRERSQICIHIHGSMKEKNDWKLELLRNIAQSVPIGMCISVHFIF